MKSSLNNNSGSLVFAVQLKWLVCSGGVAITTRSILDACKKNGGGIMIMFLFLNKAVFSLRIPKASILAYHNRARQRKITRNKKQAKTRLFLQSKKEKEFLALCCNIKPDGFHNKSSYKPSILQTTLLTLGLKFIPKPLKSFTSTLFKDFDRFTRLV
jgi:hypothetical protein